MPWWLIMQYYQYKIDGIFAAALCMHPLPCGRLQNYRQSQTVIQRIVPAVSACGAGGACCGVDA